MQKKERKIKVEGESLGFSFISEGSQEDVKTVKAGAGYIKEKFFSTEYPNDREIERALEYIEDELTTRKGLKNNDETLICSDEVLTTMLSAGDSTKFDRESIEKLFDKYVDCACGEPARVLGIEYSLEKLTTIMLVRSVMYYLDFDQIEVKS